MMNVSEAIMTRRTIRRFAQDPIPMETLRELADLARLSPCSANMQPLKYKLIEKEDAGLVFPYLRWAMAIAPQGTPGPGEQPTAYILIVSDSSIRPQKVEMDVGIAAQTIALAAWERGIASCLMALHEKEAMIRALQLSPELVPQLAIALGYPAQQSEIYPMEAGNYKYHMTPDGDLRVPKRSLDEILLSRSQSVRKSW